MKKFFALLLAAALSFGLFACAASDGSEETAAAATGLQVGYCAVDVTPYDYSVGLGGYSDMETRRSTGVLDPVYATCIALKEGDTTVLLFTLDGGHASPGVQNMAASTIAKAVDVPEENILISATHDHSAPSLSAGDSAGDQYKAMLYGAMANAAKDAVADLTPAKLFSGYTQIDGMNFIRHYYMADGLYEERTINTEYVSHTTETDNRMGLVKFEREGDKKDILLVNWAAHPDHAHQNGYTMISADYPGYLRHTVEEETGMLCAFFGGASGNQNPNSKILSEKHGLTMPKYGEKLGQYAIEALPTLKESTATGLQIIKSSVEVEINHDLDHMVDEAKEVTTVWKSEGKAAGDLLGQQYDFSSVYEARAIQARYNMPETESFDLYAFRLGDVGFIRASYEMFAEAAIYIRANAGYDTVMICNGNYGYIPSKEAYDYRCYESDTGYYVRGTSEMLAEEFVEMLKSVQ